MVTEHTHIDVGVLYFMLIDFHCLVEVRVGSPVATSDHSISFVVVVLEQSIPHLVCRQKVYLKHSVDWEQVKGDVKGLNWNNIIRSLCPVSNINEALLRVIRNRVPNRAIVV